ncbi:hypothetical protein F4679DRAFT_438500 [Xylaria curta]|nr:hypothetical protein F4679DRAFT_438500 [Xylaria curta]
MATLIPKKYRSVTEYHLREEEIDGILRHMSFKRHCVALAIIHFPPRKQARAHRLITTSFPRTSYAGLGSLDILPLELLHDVFLRLDMRSLLKVRQTNLRSRETVDTLWHFRMVISHGRDALSALVRTRLAHTVSLFDFYSALCTKACSFCGGFSGLISLLTWSRCCFDCIGNAPETQLRPLASVREQLHLTEAESDQLKSFKTLPGLYYIGESGYQSRPTEVVSIHQAMLITRRQPHMQTQTLPANSKDKKYNYMGSCILPYYDRQTGKVEHGVHCSQCYNKSPPGGDATRVYTQDDFLEHFRWCARAQNEWEWRRQNGGSP